MSANAGRALAHLIEYRRTEVHLSVGKRLDLIDTINELKAEAVADMEAREQERLDYEAGLEAPPEGDPEFDEDTILAAYGELADEVFDWTRGYTLGSRASG